MKKEIKNMLYQPIQIAVKEGNKSIPARKKKTFLESDLNMKQVNNLKNKEFIKVKNI
jgi:hypothetical protein